VAAALMDEYTRSHAGALLAAIACRSPVAQNHWSLQIADPRVQA